MIIYYIELKRKDKNGINRFHLLYKTYNNYKRAHSALIYYQSIRFPGEHILFSCDNTINQDVMIISSS